MRMHIRVLATVAAVFFLHSASGQTPDPAQLSLHFNSNHTAELTINGTPGSNYVLQYSTNLSLTNLWQTLTNFTLTGSSSLWTDTISGAVNSRFYRVIAPISVPTQITNPQPNLMVWIAPGTFTMGSPETEAQRGDDETQHSVTLTRGFYMSKYLVTQANYLDLMGNNPSQFSGSTNLPVEFVNWSDATNYCNQLTQRQRAAGNLPSTWAYRLPTEAEWEYACRAGTTTPLYLGNSLSTGMANFFVVSGYDVVIGEVYNPNTPGYVGQTTPVGSYRPNPWGLYDMAGNLWEWCQDCYGPYPSGSATDPIGPSTGEDRVIRGGSWASYGENCRSAVRFIYAPAARISYVGFRVVLAPAF